MRRGPVVLSSFAQTITTSNERAFLTQLQAVLVARDHIHHMEGIELFKDGLWRILSLHADNLNRNKEFANWLMSDDSIANWVNLFNTKFLNSDAVTRYEAQHVDEETKSKQARRVARFFNQTFKHVSQKWSRAWKQRSCWPCSVKPDVEASKAFVAQLLIAAEDRAKQLKRCAELNQSMDGSVAVLFGINTEKPAGGLEEMWKKAGVFEGKAARIGRRDDLIRDPLPEVDWSVIVGRPRASSGDSEPEHKDQPPELGVGLNVTGLNTSSFNHSSFLSADGLLADLSMFSDSVIYADWIAVLNDHLPLLDLAHINFGVNSKEDMRLVLISFLQEVGPLLTESKHYMDDSSAGEVQSYLAAMKASQQQITRADLYNILKIAWAHTQLVDGNPPRNLDELFLEQLQQLLVPETVEVVEIVPSQLFEPLDGAANEDGLVEIQLKIRGEEAPSVSGYLDPGQVEVMNQFLEAVGIGADERYALDVSATVGLHLSADAPWSTPPRTARSLDDVGREPNPQGNTPGRDRDAQATLPLMSPPSPSSMLGTPPSTVDPSRYMAPAPEPASRVNLTQPLHLSQGKPRRWAATLRDVQKQAPPFRLQGGKRWVELTNLTDQDGKKLFPHHEEAKEPRLLRYRKYAYAIFITQLTLGFTFDVMNYQGVFDWSRDFWGAGAITAEVGILGLLYTRFAAPKARLGVLAATCAVATLYEYFQSFHQDGKFNTEDSLLRKGLGIYLAMMSLSAFVRLEVMKVDPEQSVFQSKRNWAAIVGLYALYISYYFFQYNSTDAQFEHVVAGTGYYGVLVFSLELARTEIDWRFYGQRAARAVHKIYTSESAGRSGGDAMPIRVSGGSALLELRGRNDVAFIAGIVASSFLAMVLVNTQEDMVQFVSEFAQGVNLVVLSVLISIEAMRLNLRYFPLDKSPFGRESNDLWLKRKHGPSAVLGGAITLGLSAYLWAPQIQDIAWAKTFLMTAWVATIFTADLVACKVADKLVERQSCCLPS